VLTDWRVRNYTPPHSCIGAWTRTTHPLSQARAHSLTLCTIISFSSPLAIRSLTLYDGTLALAMWQVSHGPILEYSIGRVSLAIVTGGIVCSVMSDKWGR
jgi:hypothetical protein